MAKTTRNVMLATALACGMAAAASPASADWVRIGSVDVNRSMDRDVAYSRFGGGVDRLQLDAQGSDVRCRTVRATFANGRSHEIFSGRLRTGRPEVIELPGDRAQVRRLDFACRSDRRGGATIGILAEVNRYRDEWRRSPDWDRVWSRMFNWGSPTVPGGWLGPWNERDWVSVGVQTFEGRNDREAAVAGWRGRNVDRIAVKPLNGDARCSAITARFNNGRTRALDVDRGMRMVQGRGYTFDLPGGERNLREVVLRCSPVDRRSVRIEVMARK